jgi:cell division control protein 6
MEIDCGKKMSTFSELFGSVTSVFKMSDPNAGEKVGEVAFSPQFIPHKIHHREEEMRTLANLYRSIITNPVSSSRKVVLYGPVGTGKTLVSRAFCNDLTNHLYAEHQPGNPLFRFFHINCRKTKTPHLILTTILRLLIPGFPLRGYSVEELLRIFTMLLYEQNFVSLLVLDEIDYLVPDERTDFLYALSRLEESHPHRETPGERNRGIESRFNLLAITRDPNFRHYLDSSTASSLGKNWITFPPYTRYQLFDIIDYRAKQGLQEESYTDELIETIASLSEEFGDARFAIELLWRAAKVADHEQKSGITAEHVRQAMVSVLPVEKSFIEDLNTHQKILLLSIAQLLNNNVMKNHVTTPEVKTAYSALCEQASIRPRRHTQVWSYIKDLARLGLIHQTVENRHHENGRSLGRVTSIRIRDIPTTEIIQTLQHLLE